MRRLTLLVLLLSACLNTADDPLNSAGTQPETNVLSVVRQTSFGECAGYCVSKLLVEADRATMVWSGWKTTIEDPLPDVSKTLTWDEQRWNQVMDVVDRQALLTLPSTIGCPDCADGGAEKVLVSFTNDEVAVGFEFGADVAPIQALVQHLRELASQAPRPDIK